MLKAIELENFKAFGDRSRIEFAPITLIFGENSAGKSSILQALNLLKQSREGRDTGAVVLPRADSGIVDLGGFKEMVFDHDLDRRIAIRVDLIDSGSRLQREARDGMRGDTAFQIEFDRPSNCKEIQLKSISLYASELAQLVATFEPIDYSDVEQQKLSHGLLPVRNYRPESTNETTFAQCVFLSPHPSLWQEIYERTKRRSEKIADELRQLQSESQDSTTQLSIFNVDDSERQTWSLQVDEAIQFYDSNFSIVEFVKRMMRAESQTKVALDGFIPLPLRHRETAGLPELETFRRYGPSRLRMRELTLDLMSYAVESGRRLEGMLDSVYPLGPFRRPPARLYAFAGKSPHDVGYAGDQLPDLLFRRPEVVREANQWMDRLEIGYHIKVQPVGEDSRDLYEVRLVDRQRSTEVDVALTDVGFGISQILPLIIQSLAGDNQIITIEQPEVHIHPRLQADLGDLLAATIQEPRGHRFIVETHSEHLVLRMQRLIREEILSPSDVSILYVRRGPKGSQVERLRLDESGEFIDDWPGGFFPERLRELM
ncbi:DUF3696 domain-containing protein [Novipirellula rosea]|uniref:Recombination protein F n=1 Tax=Novipirellula rosea TaxID=1031540 RepID=A0ABP8M6G7_9BACT